MEKTSVWRLYTSNRMLLALLGAALLLSACNAHRSTNAGAPVAGIDPCSLVTRADAERILQAHVEPAIHRETVLMATGYQCRYIIADHGHQTQGIAITVYDDVHIQTQDTLFKNAADYFHRDMRALRGSGTRLVAIKGLGTAAYWQPGQDLLHLLDHGVYVMLDVEIGSATPAGPEQTSNSQNEAAKRAADIALARESILPRLGNPSLLSNHPPHSGNRGHAS